MSHTPGPWEVQERESQRWNSPSSPVVEVHALKDYGDGKPTHYALAEVSYPTSRQGTVGAEERRANARLMAAAPELLEALKECQRQCWVGARNRDADPLLAKVKAAIAKAEGKS